MSNDKIRSLVRWNSADARAVAEQLLERVIRAEKQGLTVGVVTCFIYDDSNGSRGYEPAFSTLPLEVTLWAAEKIKRRIFQVQEEL